jgi:hypothetical protein
MGNLLGRVAVVDDAADSVVRPSACDSEETRGTALRVCF